MTDTTTLHTVEFGGYDEFKAWSQQYIVEYEEVWHTRQSDSLWRPVSDDAFGHWIFGRPVTLRVSGRKARLRAVIHDVPSRGYHFFLDFESEAEATLWALARG